MRTRTFGVILLVLFFVSRNGVCQTWQEMTHVIGMDTIRASDIEAILVPAEGTYLVATDKGVYRSTDAGIHWSLPWGDFGFMLFSHPDGRTFVGNFNGLAFSTDIGDTWSFVSGFPLMPTTSMTRDSQGRLFTGTWSYISSTGGAVYRSTNNGTTWLKALDSVEIELVQTFPGDVLYAGGWPFLRRSVDGGQTWKILFNGAGVRSVTVTQNGSILFGWYLTSPSLMMATYRSTDDGQTWAPVAGFYSEYFATDASNYIYAACDSGMRRSTDNGTTWQVLNTGLLNRNGVVPWLRSLYRIGSTELIAGEYHTGEIFRSTDLGEHWSTLSTVQAMQATSAKLSAVAFRKPDKLFLSSSTYGVEQWTEGGGLLTVNSGLADTRVQAVHVAETGDLFAGTAAGVYRSTNNGAAWVKFGTTTLFTKALADLPNGSVLSGTNSGVIKYAADGSSLSTMNAGLGSRSVNTLWAGTDGRAFVGTEDGLYRLDSVTWKPISVTGSTLKVIDVDVFGQTIALAARDSGIYVSTDNGQGWQHKVVGMEGLAVTAIVLTAQDKIYAATEQNGIFVTTTAGSSWSAASGGLNDLRLKDLAIGPGGYLYTISDSGAVCRTSLPVVAVGDLQPAEPSAYVLEQNFPNPFNPSTIIRYALPRRSHVSLSVFNTLGQQLAILVQGEQEAGYHEAGLDASGLASGVYLYRLQAGDFVRTRKLLLLR